MRILIIEDEKKVASLIRKGLEKEGFMVDVTYHGKDGLVKAHHQAFDAIILDLMLPGYDGLQILGMLSVVFEFFLQKFGIDHDA